MARFSFLKIEAQGLEPRRGQGDAPVRGLGFPNGDGLTRGRPGPQVLLTRLPRSWEVNAKSPVGSVQGTPDRVTDGGLSKRTLPARLSRCDLDRQQVWGAVRGSVT